MLDPSIPLGVKNAELPNPLELQRAYREAQTAKKQGRMSDLLLAGAERDNAKAVEADNKARTIKGLLQVNTEAGPNGAPTLNKGRLIGDLGRLGYTQEAMDFQRQEQADQHAAAKAKRQEFTEKLGLMGQILGGHNAQNYPTKYAALKALGFDESDGIPDPSKYDPNMIEGALKQGLTYKERLELADKEETRKDSRTKQTAQEKKDADAAALEASKAAEAKRHNLATEGIARTAAGKPKPGSAEAALPMDVKKQIETISAKTAGKKLIANQLDNDLIQLRKALGQDANGKQIPGAKRNEDLAVNYAQSMLKTMNSKEGADAVGVDEAKRSANLLEYNTGDVSALLGIQPGKFIGRDLDGFASQVASISEGIKGSVNSNQAEVDRLYGRPAPGATPPPAQLAPGMPISGNLKPNRDGSFDYVPGGR